MALVNAKVPAALASGIICLLLGGGLGAVIMWAAASKSERQQPSDAGQPGDDGKGGGDTKGAGMKGMGGGSKGGDKKGGGGQRGPSPKTQLAQLVSKLDVLTGQSLHVALSSDEKKQAQEQLADLADKEDVNDEVAKAKLDALLKLLEPHRQTLEDSGYRWPGGGGGGGGFGGGGGGGGASAPPNPFKVGDGAEHLKSLLATLGK